MQPEIFKTFLERVVQNQRKVIIITSGQTEKFYGVITQYDDEVIEGTINGTEESAVIFRKDITFIYEFGNNIEEKDHQENITGPLIVPEEIERLKKQWEKASKHITPWTNESYDDKYEAAAKAHQYKIAKEYAQKKSEKEPIF